MREAELGARIRAARREKGFSQQELASLDRMQKKMLRNLSALTRSDCKKEET